MIETKIEIQPLGDRVVVKPDEPQTQRPSGIYIAETTKERPQRGSVLAVGPGKWEDGKLEPITVAAGDTVLFAKYAGTEIKLDNGDEVIILTQKDILATITG